MLFPLYRNCSEKMLKSVTALKFLKGSNILAITQSRSFRDDLPVDWKRPKDVPFWKPEKTGDLKPFANVYDKEYPVLYERSKELQTADEIVKRLFTLEFQPKKVVNETVAHRFADPVRKHTMDNQSLQIKIARLTSTIRKMQVYMESRTVAPPGKTTHFLNDMIQKRKKFLKLLRLYDYKAFEWLLEKLDLVYKPFPTEHEEISRKMGIRKLTEKHCEDMKQKKISKYRAYLESQQVDFLREKLQTLEWIQSNEKELKIPVTITDKEINDVKEDIERRVLEQKQKV